MRVLVAMSGGVDSSVAASLLVEQGHDVAGATLKLWGGAGDSGCCSVADAIDARRVADAIGIDHHVFNLTEEFADAVVDPYVAAHALGHTPNPCAACNRHLKFDLLLGRALRLGFDAIATGHHARVVAPGEAHAGTWVRDAGHRLRRGADAAKDQSYVLSMLTSETLEKVLLPVGAMTKSAVRAYARSRGLRTADKPESQDVCFIASRTPGAGRAAFLAERIALHPGTVVDVGTGEAVGSVDAVELVTIGQRRGLPASPGGSRRYAVSVDVATRTVAVGSREDLESETVELTDRTWAGRELPVGSSVSVQVSAHGAARAATTTTAGVTFAVPERRVAPGQLVALYRGDLVAGSGIAR